MSTHKTPLSVAHITFSTPKNSGEASDAEDFADASGERARMEKTTVNDSACFYVLMCFKALPLCSS